MKMKVFSIRRDEKEMSATLNLKFFTGVDEYLDGAEACILADLKNGLTYDEIMKKYVSEEDSRMKYMIFYHLSIDRHNILSWYDFEPESTILEIGAGCGALTGLFVEKCRHVVAVDLSKPRCLVNYERHKSADNLEIVVANLNALPSEYKFDYITLIGVLEYCGEYTKSENPYKDFLLKVKTFLNPGGKLIIAIENRLGLRYFNGALEDHFIKSFVGLNNYTQTSRGVRTFSRSELGELLDKSGFCNTEIYLAHPDYKHTMSIVSESAQEFHELVVSDSPNHFLYPIKLFSEGLMMRSVAKEKMYSVMGNSFLVFCQEDSVN